MITAATFAAVARTIRNNASFSQSSSLPRKAVENKQRTTLHHHHATAHHAAIHHATAHHIHAAEVHALASRGVISKVAPILPEVLSLLCFFFLALVVLVLLLLLLLLAILTCEYQPKKIEATMEKKGRCDKPFLLCCCGG
jgi:hypothetical protein